MAENKLKLCLEACVNTVQNIINRYKQCERSQQDPSVDDPLSNPALDVNIYSFTMDVTEKSLMSELKTKLENILDNHLCKLSKFCRKYLLDSLHEFEYDYGQREFKRSFNIGNIDSLKRDLRGALLSIDAFQAAQNGQKLVVAAFIEKFPTFKDKVGLWGTSLLYSAAKNNHSELVEYLISKAKCSVNIQNQQDTKRSSLGTAMPHDDSNVDSIAGSTALHGACSNGHLNVMKFLIEHDADYFIRNHRQETPIANAAEHLEILEFFKNFLILGYSSISTNLPDAPISAEDDKWKVDCVWEYKPTTTDAKWDQFSDSESEKLQKTLQINPDQKFNREIHLNLGTDIHSVCLMKFLISGECIDYTRKMAWVRCRGSSVLNFSCCALWQMMFITHPLGQANSTLEMNNIPTIEDGRFQIQLHSWYFCDARINIELDRTMNYRRKQINLEIPYVHIDILVFNLEAFSFTSTDEKITGYIRWIPKMISNNPRHKDKIINIDQYATLTDLDPIPLTTTRLKQMLNVSDMPSIRNDDEEEGVTHIDNSIPIKSNEAPGTPPPGLQILREFSSPINPSATNAAPLDQSSNTKFSFHTTNPDLMFDSLPDHLVVNTSEECINEKRAMARLAQQPSIVENVQAPKNEKCMVELNQEIDSSREEAQKLFKDLRVESLSDLKTIENEEQLPASVDKQRTEQQQKEVEQRYREKMKEGIKTVGYSNVPNEIVHNFLSPNGALIYDYLRRVVTGTDSSLFADQIPRITSEKINDQYIINVTGIEGHHIEFKRMLAQILLLLNLIQLAKDFYQKKFIRLITNIADEVLPQVQPRTLIWQQYIQLFLQLLKNKRVESEKDFDDCLHEKFISLVNPWVLAQLDDSAIHIRKKTDDFLQNHDLIDELELIKQKALDEFIEQNISLQHLRLHSKLNPKSISVLENFIEKVRREFKNDPEYRGDQIEQFRLIPQLLERLMVYYSCFKIQLPLFEYSEELLDQINKHDVTTISTSTGSGKSTLLPALLIAEGYAKVIVTQPRRLPCQLICKRVNETMTIDGGTSAKKLAGWVVSGAEYNPEAKVLYLIDALLKDRLLYDDHFLTRQTTSTKSIVFFIDEVHERSVNIDLCLAFLARLLTTKPELRTRMKVVISSATLDSSVPALFQNIPQVCLLNFDIPSMGTSYKVTEYKRPNQNILDLVQELCRKRQGQDQILCFVSSSTDAYKCCRLLKEISRGLLVAYPLVQTQNPDEQQLFIKQGSIFFSTTVAETSLTFPWLKYVIDTGTINTPVYDTESKRTILKEVQAAASTIKQRRGRLGRTRSGEYYSLYSFTVNPQSFPISQICQSDLINIEFSLRKSPLKNGLKYLQQFLPDRPSQTSINETVEQLKKLNILQTSSTDRFTDHGEDLAQLPDFGSLAMSKAVLAALFDRNCGHDLICLSSILGVLNTTLIFKSIPQRFKSPDGDFMTLLNIMNELLLVKQSIAPHQFNLEEVCRAKGLSGATYPLQQALRRYTFLERLFDRSDRYRRAAQIKSGNWELIAKALLEGYSNNVFLSMRHLQGRNLHFARYNNENDQLAIVLDSNSTLTRPISTAPVSLVLARDIRYATAIREKAIICFVGEIRSEWLDHSVQRRIELTDTENEHLISSDTCDKILSIYNHQINLDRKPDFISLKGPANNVLAAELRLRQEMISEKRFTLKELTDNVISSNNFNCNLERVLKLTRIFNPMKWRWQTEKQVEIIINSNTAMQTCEFTVKGRHSATEKVQQEFRSFIGWLRSCAVIRDPNSGVSPRVLRSHMRKSFEDMEERIAHVTNSNRTAIDLYNGTKARDATRETRMEVVAWIAVCQFDCRLEGGFVRDWIVGGYSERPTNLKDNPKAWIQIKDSIPTLDKELVPCDLDCHLPSHAYFDINKFQDELYKYGLTCSVIRQDWRYVLLFDENETTGPFTMDLIEPHVALTHDRIDFDVNNLSLEKNFTHELGMRIDITQRPYSIELETIVSNIRSKCFQVLRPEDKSIAERINKMTHIRKWEKIATLSVLPDLHWKCNFILVRLPSSAALYIEVSNKMRNVPRIKILSIEQIRNPSLEETYEGMKKLIKNQCRGANHNEQELFHGTKGDAITGILEVGFDDRFFSLDGQYGHGAYFADNPYKAHGYTASDADNGNTRVMFYSKVLLGTPLILTAVNQTLVSAPIGYHSIIGTHTPYTEYIIYRYGQALPYLKITYITRAYSGDLSPLPTTQTSSESE